MVPLAHAGGWDELAFTLLPAVVFFLVLQLRRKRLEAKQAAERAAERTAEDETQDPRPR